MGYYSGITGALGIMLFTFRPFKMLLYCLHVYVALPYSFFFFFFGLTFDLCKGSVPPLASDGVCAHSLPEAL